MRLLQTVTGVMLVLAIASSLDAQANRTDTPTAPLNTETFSPSRWEGSRWILYFHDDLSNSYYTYKAKSYVANYSMKFAIRGKDGHYAVVSFIDGQLYCDPKTGARSQFLNLGGDDYRVSDGVRVRPFDPLYMQKRDKVVPGSTLDIVSKAVCKAVLASGGDGWSR